MMKRFPTATLHQLFQSSIQKTFLYRQVSRRLIQLVSKSLATSLHRSHRRLTTPGFSGPICLDLYAVLEKERQLGGGTMEFLLKLPSVIDEAFLIWLFTFSVKRATRRSQNTEID